MIRRRHLWDVKKYNNFKYLQLSNTNLKNTNTLLLYLIEVTCYIYYH